jgi:hypothetical protein
MALSIGHCNPRVFLALTLASAIIATMGCMPVRHAPRMPRQLLAVPTTLDTGIYRAAPMDQPVSRSAVLDVTFGRVDLRKAEGGRSICPTRARVIIKGFYRNPASDGQGYTELKGDAEWTYCIGPDTTVRVPIGTEFSDLAGSVRIGVEGRDGARAELTSIILKP